MKFSTLSGAEITQAGVRVVRSQNQYRGLTFREFRIDPGANTRVQAEEDYRERERAPDLWREGFDDRPEACDSARTGN